LCWASYGLSWLGAQKDGEAIIKTSSERKESATGPDREQKRYPGWLWIFIVVTLLITTLPYWLGFASQGEAWHFTGFVFGVQDGNSYIAKMLRGATGEWLFRTPYTARHQVGRLIFLPFILMGKLSAASAQHEQLVVLYQFFRLFAGALSMMASYDFLSAFIKAERWRKWGILLMIWGGGLGWAFLFFGKTGWLGSLPLEMYSPETFGFLALYGLPHLSLGRALLLWGLMAFLFPGVTPGRIHPGVYAGLLWLLMGLMQPLTVVMAWAVLLSFLCLISLRPMWSLWKHRNDAGWKDIIPWWRRAAWVVLLSAPIVIYTVWVFKTDTILKSWETQNRILSPHPFHYLLAYGLLLPFAVLGMRAIIKEQVSGPAWLLISWTLALPVLVYAPYPLQRRLAEGYWAALVILALVWFERPQAKASGRVRWVLLLALPSSMILIIGGVHQAINPSLPIFRPNAEVAAFGYLQHNATTDDVLLAAYETGNASPAWAATFVLIGHGPESVGIKYLQPRVNAFYEKETRDAERLILIEEFGIDYIFWGPHERALGEWAPDQAGYLEPVYDQSGYAIYRTRP
jgi:hypothetical protein